MMDSDEERNFASFRDCLSGTLLISFQPETKEKPKPKRRSRKAQITTVRGEEHSVVEKVEDLAEFIDVCLRFDTNLRLTWN
jgi:hypothetical protein